MENRARVCAIIGPEPSSPSPGEDDAQLGIEIFEEILKKISGGCVRFMICCAHSTAILCSELILNMKLGDPGIRLICIVPGGEREKTWPSRWQMRYRRVLKLADRTVAMNPERARPCLEQCARYMVEHSTELIAICGDQPGEGVACAVDCAQKRALPVTCVFSSAASE